MTVRTQGEVQNHQAAPNTLRPTTVIHTLLRSPGRASRSRNDLLGLQLNGLWGTGKWLCPWEARITNPYWV